MRKSGEFINLKWLRIFQVVVGLACIAISIVIMVELLFTYSKTSAVGVHALIFLASIAFIIIGIEQIVVGIKSTSLKRSSRLISIGIGVGIVVYFGSAINLVTGERSFKHVGNNIDEEIIDLATQYAQTSKGTIRA